MASIFLSHNKNDKLFVRRLAKDLEAAGVRVWLDEAELLPGDSLLSAIQIAISEMEYLAVVLSTNSIKSAWVERELNMAMTEEIQGQKVKVVPLLLEDCELPGFLQDKLWVDFRNDDNYLIGLTLVLRRLGLEAEQELFEPKSKAIMMTEEAKLVQCKAAAFHGYEVFWTNSVGMQFVFIPAGDFIMGTSRDSILRQPRHISMHRVFITKPFLLGVNIVTREQWEAVMLTEPWKAAKDLDHWTKVKPHEFLEEAATYVSWDDANRFCVRLGEMENQRYRLPTEAEWEYSCLAGFYESEREYPWGLENMLCSNEQWCSDWYGEYPKDEAIDPKGPNDGIFRVARGGIKWRGYDTYSYGAGCRHKYKPEYRHLDLGFRVAKNV
jgi:formylglycine-generating enzyme required for sulfatase activity